MYAVDMSRTNIVLNDRLVERAMRLYGFRTKREAVDFALRRLVGEGSREGLLSLRGIGWEGDLDKMRDTEPVETW